MLLLLPYQLHVFKVLKKKRQEAPNGVVYAKPHIPKPRFNLITVSAIPETES